MPVKSKRPSIRQLEYFVTVARAANFRKAADRLKISQPTLTSQIAALEASLGTKLFERSRAGTLLSSPGRELLPIARQVLEQYQTLLDQAASAGRDLGGTYRIGVSPTLGPCLLPRILPELHSRYGDLRLHVREEEPAALERGLADGYFDLILTMLPMDSSEYKVRPLFVEPLDIVMAADHPLAEREPLKVADLRGQPVLNLDRGHLHRQVANLCEQFGARPLRDLEGNSLDSLRQMVSMGMGLAFLPALYVQSAIDEGDRLVVRRLAEEPLTRTHVAAWRRQSSSRHLFQKISYEIKSLAMERFDATLEEVKAEDNAPTFSP